MTAVAMTQDKEEGERKVTFQQRLPARVAGLLDQMVDCLHAAGHQDMDLEVSTECYMIM